MHTINIKNRTIGFVCSYSKIKNEQQCFHVFSEHAGGGQDGSGDSFKIFLLSNQSQQWIYFHQIVIHAFEVRMGTAPEVLLWHGCVETNFSCLAYRFLSISHP